MTTARKDLWTPMTYGWLDSDEYRDMKPGPLKVWITMTSWAHRSGKAGLLGAMLDNDCIGVSRSYQELAQFAGVSEKSVRRHVETLVDAKWIVEGQVTPRRRFPVWMIGRFYILGDDRKLRCWYFAHQSVPGSVIWTPDDVRSLSSWNAAKIGFKWHLKMNASPLSQEDVKLILDTAPFSLEAIPKPDAVQ